MKKMIHPGEPPKSQVPETEDPTEPPVKKKFYKMPIFWIVIAIAAAIVILLIMFLYVIPQNRLEREITQTQETFTTNWSDVIEKSEDLANLGKDATSSDDFEDITSAAEDVLDELDEAKDAIDSASIPEAEKENSEDIKAFIETYSSYLNLILNILDNPTEAEESDFDDAADLAKDLEDAVKKALDGADYLGNSFPEDIYELHTVLQTIIQDEIAELEAKEAAEKEAQEEAKRQEQIEADEEEVRQNTTGFLQAFVDGDAVAIRRYMTEDYVSEYNFSQLSPEEREFVAPESFRIVDISRVSDEQYEVDVRITYVTFDTGDRWTVDRTLVVVFDQGYEKWLVDREVF